MQILQTHRQLNMLGITKPNRIYWQLNTPQLYEEAVQRHEGYVAHLGPLVVRTGNQTSLTQSDRFIVAEPATQGNISWGEVNRAFDPDRFDKLVRRMGAYFNGLDIFVQDCYVRTATVKQKMGIRVVTETAWHNLFVRNSYIHPDLDDLYDFVPEFTILHAPGFRAIPERDGTNSDVFVIINLNRKLVLVGGTSFAGEIQKAIFSVLNYMLPRNDILTMECAANIGDDGDVALFVGVDGSGKTTLATEESRRLIGDAEHGWDGDGIFSIGRGCYANTLNLSVSTSADIWQTTRRFGTILENVVVDTQTRRLDLNDDSFTENTRASYPISHLLCATRDGVASHPRNIILLTRDGYGVLPLVSKLTHEQAYYYYLSGYTTEVVTNRYGDTFAQPRFTSCYGAPFMPLHPGHYARMFADKVKQHNVDVWLVNTGWIGGPYGANERVSLATTQHVIRAILNNQLMHVEFTTDAHFGLKTPIVCPNVPARYLNPASHWVGEMSYDEAVKELVRQFDENFGQYENEVNPAILATQPRYS